MSARVKVGPVLAPLTTLLCLRWRGVRYDLNTALDLVTNTGELSPRRWTFAGHVGDSLTPVRWGVVQGCGLALNEGLLYLFVDGAGVEKLLGQAFATGIVTVITFLVNRAWTFRMHPPAAAVDADG